MGNDTEDRKGRAKEGLGALTDDDDLAREGRLDQAKASVKDTIDRVGDKVKELIRN